MVKTYGEFSLPVHVDFFCPVDRFFCFCKSVEKISAHSLVLVRLYFFLIAE